MWTLLRVWRFCRIGCLTHASPIYTRHKAEMATERAGVLLSTKWGSEGIKTPERRTCTVHVVEGSCGFFFFWLWKPFWLLNTSAALFGLPKRCTVAELLHIAYDSDNDSVHIGIILLCEVLASSLLNMHECLKWILEDPPPPPHTHTPPPPHCQTI